MKYANVYLRFCVSTFCLHFRCDVCLSGHPEQQNLQEEAKSFMQVLAAQCVSVAVVDFSFLFDDNIFSL